MAQVGRAAGRLGFGSCSTAHRPCALGKPRDRSGTQCSPLWNGHDKILPTQTEKGKICFRSHMGHQGVKTAVTPGAGCRGAAGAPGVVWLAKSVYVRQHQV